VEHARFDTSGAAAGEETLISGIAAHLVLSESAIKTHVSRVLAKTGARDRVHAVIIAYNASLVRPAGSPEAS
jgi:Bacterial regulatory proteins, luxR family